MKTLITNPLWLLLFLILTAPLFPQAGVGKLSGKVTDAATKEPLIGANIMILNTDWGAATNVDGEYFVLNIPPGNYSVRFSYVGYAPLTIQDVRIVGGVTYELNVELSTDFTLPEIVVQDRKFFEEKATNTKKVFDSEQISRLPVRGVQKLASLQSGVVMAEGSGGVDGNATINVRGGRGGEVLYIVDGVVQNDIYTGANYSQVSNSAIEQIAFEIGGYEAKYGQAQSGIISVTTKTGAPTFAFYGDVLSSAFTDDYGYNLYTLNLSGPIIPGNNRHTFFFSGERGWFLDGSPKAVVPSFPSNNDFPDYIRSNDESSYKFTGRTSHNLGDFNLRFGANINERKFRGYVHTYAKHNWQSNPRTERMNSSFTARISQNVSSNSFWNLNLGYRFFNNESGDGIWFNNVEAYGDSASLASINVDFPRRADGTPRPFPNGSRLAQDDVGIFFKFGRPFNNYSKTNNQTFTLDADFTAQIENHLIEVGGGGQYNILRFYSIGPIGLASDNLKMLSDPARYYRMQPSVFGYNITGTKKTDNDMFEPHVLQTGRPAENIQVNFEPNKPVLIYAYAQDRFELSDFVLNFGLRFDYFDPQTDILKNPDLPFHAGDPFRFDKEDFIKKKPETHISPRIGLGFPITATTVFHAQYGKFIQQPQLDQLYASVFDLNAILVDDARSLFNGHVDSEVTTQYEVGFRQVLGDVAALNITAFYKNTEGLINRSLVFFQRAPGGEILEYYAPTNTDFGTIKGLALSLDVARISYFSLSANYTYAIAEGTGSSTASSFIAVFRNTGPDRIPKVIAPLDFDQRHTGTFNIDFFVPKGMLGFFELLNANVLISFASGRPYTPLATQNLLEGSSNWGDTRGYVNSAFGPGNFRIDLKLEKGFAFGDATITPYLWIENVLDAKNPVDVYRSTGDPFSTAYLATDEAQRIAASQSNPSAWIEDYKSLERNPFNFGIPRLIRLGLKVNFANISF